MLILRFARPRGAALSVQVGRRFLILRPAGRPSLGSLIGSLPRLLSFGDIILDKPLPPGLCLRRHQPCFLWRFAAEREII